MAKNSEGLNLEIKKVQKKILVGMSIKMSLSTNYTQKLFKAFMPSRMRIPNGFYTGIYDLRVYDEGYYRDFNPSTEFTKWALIEVEQIEDIPEEMQVFNLNSGLYAVFNHIGNINDTQIFQEIFTSWLPNSKYTLDDRPHYDIMYLEDKNTESIRQEIHIPIK